MGLKAAVAIAATALLLNVDAQTPPQGTVYRMDSTASCSGRSVSVDTAALQGWVAATLPAKAQCAASAGPGAEVVYRVSGADYKAGVYELACIKTVRLDLVTCCADSLLYRHENDVQTCVG